LDSFSDLFILIHGFEAFSQIFFKFSVADSSSSTKPLGPATKAVYGTCMDPFGEHRVASYHDNMLNIWDMRNFEKPIASHESHKPISQIQWSPTRYGLLGMSLKESADLHLLDVQHAHATRDEYEPVLLERSFNGRLLFLQQEECVFMT
jgi:WD repeat-containing protein mio